MRRSIAPTLLTLPLLALAAVSPVRAFAQSYVAEANGYQTVLSSAYPMDEPGAAAIVARNGEVVFLGASGMANLEHGVALETDMVFEIGSITKQVTAAAIMMLAERGELSVDDPITKFLPDYPAYGDGITIEHLLTHTSGIVSYTGIPGYMAAEARKDVSVEELIDVFDDLPVEFAPGDRWNYNNSGYILLGAIIENVSGLTYEEFVEKKIFDRLGLQDSYYGSLSEIIPGRALGYQGDADGYRNADFLSMTQPYAAGALMMNVEDLYRWNQALHGGELLGAQTYQRMITPYVLNDGEETGYAYGLALGDVRGRPAIKHGGGIFGYATDAIYLPEEDLFVAVFSNNTGSDIGPGLVATKLAAIAVGEPYPLWEEIALEEAFLQRYVGVYEIDENTQRVVTVEERALFTQRTGGQKLRALPSSESHFFYKGSLSHFEFVVDDEGRVTAMLMYQGGSDTPERALKISDEVPVRQAVDLDPAVYERYVGVYELAPGFDLSITREGDALMVQATGQRQFELTPESETKFFLEVIDAQITFVQGADGEVNELVLHQAGRDTRGTRKK